ncbi:hypothetical protein VNO78_22604 [Psophocarpus tetragonolobus]|uniref:Uncharacterized protein n=1 Tax=Psophocarpus tetragonolobus TaxID=3891 RepID=A0AAN9XC83_PSOTE
MTRQSLSMRIPKSGLMQRCSRHFREQKTRFYIIWRCTVFLMRVAARLQLHCLCHKICSTKWFLSVTYFACIGKGSAQLWRNQNTSVVDKHV